MFCIVVFFVIPKMGDILKELNTELPMITVAVVSFGNFMLNFWYLALLIAILTYGAWDYFIRRRPERYDALKLRIPFVKGITYSQMQFRFASVFGMCLMANIDSKTSLKYAANAASNIFMRKALLAAIRKMEASGAPIVEALMKSNVYNVIHPDFFTMIRAGSKGNLYDESLRNSHAYKTR